MARKVGWATNGWNELLRPNSIPVGRAGTCGAMRAPPTSLIRAASASESRKAFGALGVCAIE